MRYLIFREMATFGPGESSYGRKAVDTGVMCVDRAKEVVQRTAKSDPGGS